MQDLIEVKYTSVWNEDSKTYDILFSESVHLELLRFYFKLEEIWINPQTLICEFINEKIYRKRIQIYHNECLSIEISKKVKSIKLYLDNGEKFSFINLKVFVRKYKGLLVSITDDGMGMRLTNMLVSMYLANLCGYKFGFVWNPKMNPCGTEVLRQNYKSLDNRILLPQIESEEFLFDESFIKKHSYTKMITRDKKHLARNIPLTKLQENLPYEDAFGWSYQDSGMHIIGVDKSYLSEIPRLYKEISFSSHIQKIIKQAEECANSFGNFIALHLRGGDVVYDLFTRSSGRHYKKSTPIEIAFEILYLYYQTMNIVIFSDDITTMNALLAYANKNLKSPYKILSITNFLPKNLNEVERIFFEFTFMSLAQEIFSSFSHFAYLASIIRKGKEHNFIFQFFDEKMQIKIISKHLGKITIHPIAQAISYFHLYMLKRNNKDFQALEELSFKAMRLDSQNLLYKIAFLDSLIKEEKLLEAEKLLEELLKNRESFYKTFFNCVLFLNYPDVAQDIFKNLHQSINFRDFAREIAKFKRIDLENGAIIRVKNYLNFKLGDTYIRTNGISLLFALYKTKKEHFYYKQFQKQMIESGEMKPLKPLVHFADYFEALEILQGKECRIGQEIKKADKSFLKLGFLTLYFKCKSIISQENSKILSLEFKEANK